MSPDETSEVEEGITDLVKKLRVAAREEPQTEFARKMLMAINEIVVPAILRWKGLGFDYNSLRRLWQISKEFQVAWATSAHPRHDGWLTFATATIDLSADGGRIEGLRFESSLDRMHESFLDRLYDAYNQMQEWTSVSIVTAWELRATFCFRESMCAGRF